VPALYRLGDKEGARQRLYLAVALQPDGEAWNNLGLVLEELGQWDEAYAAYLQALALGCADAHYNIADLLDKLGTPGEAVGHWRAYVQQDADSPWGRHARRRLSATEPGRGSA
jgi:Flp pilus assembly protein TadD